MELGFAWHHSKQPKHARSDFEDMLKNNCNAVVIAASEDDLNYWYPNLIEIIETAKDVGLKAIVNFWAFGGVFGGEPPSMFLHQNHRYRQITAESMESVPGACINRVEFREYLFENIRNLVHDASPDGVFLDEPHYFPLFDESEYTCTCEVCQSKYSEIYGTSMPKEYSTPVKEFRKDSMHDFLLDCCRTIKDARPQTEITVCIIPLDLVGFGTPDWERIASIPQVDVFSTDPYYHVFGRDRKWALEAATRTVKVAKEFNKKSQLWIQMFKVSKGEEEEIASLVPAFVALDVDSIFAWSYLANQGTTIACENPELIWDLVTKEFKKIGM
ncbi:MAG: hypothetical protein ACFFED_06845 [Candidatus Thorarchaeota archaeon]